MADVFDTNKRSEIMRKVRSKNNKSTEQRLIEIFKKYGITGWRRSYAIKGHPDFVFLEKKVAIFVDGCFWHGHDCRNTRPQANKEYWDKKRESNYIRDRQTDERLSARGWKVLRIWECELRKKNEQVLIDKLFVALDIGHRL